MMKNNELQTILDAAEGMIAALPTVPTAPLVHGQQVAESVDDLPDDLPEGSEGRLRDLLEAMAGIEWSFWPEGAYGSREALVDGYQLQQVADCLQKVKGALKHAGQD